MSKIFKDLNCIHVGVCLGGSDSVTICSSFVIISFPYIVLVFFYNQLRCPVHDFLMLCEYNNIEKIFAFQTYVTFYKNIDKVIKDFSLV